MPLKPLALALPLYYLLLSYMNRNIGMFCLLLLSISDGLRWAKISLAHFLRLCRCYLVPTDPLKSFETPLALVWVTLGGWNKHSSDEVRPRLSHLQVLDLAGNVSCSNYFDFIIPKASGEKWFWFKRKIIKIWNNRHGKFSGVLLATLICN